MFLHIGGKYVNSDHIRELEIMATRDGQRIFARVEFVDGEKRDYTCESAFDERLLATVIPAPEGYKQINYMEAMDASDTEHVELSPIIAFRHFHDNFAMKPLTVDGAGTNGAIMRPDGRVFEPDGLEFETLDEYLAYARNKAKREAA